MRDERHVMLVSVLFHADPVTSDGNKTAMAAEIVARSTGREFAYSHIVDLSGRQSRPRKLNLGDFRDAEGKGDILPEGALSLTLHENTRVTDSDFQLVFESVPAFNPDTGSAEAVLYPYRTYFLTPITESLDTGRIVEAMCELHTLLESPYAFLHPTTSATEAHSEATLIPVFRAGFPRQLRDELAEQRLERCQSERVRLGESICAAYWGNVLGRRLAAKLGGEKKISTNARCEYVATFADGQVYVQLTNELPLSPSDAFELQLAQLEAYFLALAGPAS